MCSISHTLCQLVGLLPYTSLTRIGKASDDMLFHAAPCSEVPNPTAADGIAFRSHQFCPDHHLLLAHDRILLTFSELLPVQDQAPVGCERLWGVFEDQKLQVWPVLGPSAVVMLGVKCPIFRSQPLIRPELVANTTSRHHGQNPWDRNCKCEL